MLPSRLKNERVGCFLVGFLFVKVRCCRIKKDVANVSYESQRIRAFDLTHLEEQNRRFVRYYIHCRNNTYDMSFIYEYY